MAVFQLVILDMVSDSSPVTVKQLRNVVNKHQLNRIWPENLYNMYIPDEQLKVLKQDADANSILINCLLEAKNNLDSDGNFNFVLVTSPLLKKFWEKVCYTLFSPLHNWAVYGVTVVDQPLHSIMNVDEEYIEMVIKNLLMKIGKADDVEILRPLAIPKETFNAGFSTRHGGASFLEPLASLNLVYTSRKVDSMAFIEENRRRLALTAGFDPSTIYCARVEHGNAVRVVEKEFEDSPSVRYDGLVTNTPGVTLFAPGADCCPILLADTKTGACGAVHAGWMGTVKGAVKETLKTMVKEYGTKPVDVIAAIGPSVETQCFSLPSSSAKPLSDLDPSLTPINELKTNLVFVNLVRANAILLEKEGVLPENIDTTWALCTKCHGERFFSHQRDGVPFGNQVGFISCIKQE